MPKWLRQTHTWRIANQCRIGERRQNLAPKKKKEHYKDAYELFKQSFEMGRADAFKKMEEMEKEMD